MPLSIHLRTLIYIMPPDSVCGLSAALELYLKKGRFKRASRSFGSTIRLALMAAEGQLQAIFGLKAGSEGKFTTL